MDRRPCVVPDRPDNPRTGPDGLWDPDRPPTRAQLASVAVLACELLGMDAPTSREAASIALTRLRMATTDDRITRAIAETAPF